MSKLLFALDFEHFHQTGRAVTGLTYYAWTWGPYPKDVMENMDEHNFPDDLAKHIGIIPKAIYDEDETGYLFKIKHKAKLNLDIFSKRESDIMKNWAT
ncbi:MAG TPA: type II toxin-antitoxin system antitoxin SocA domain-containing protein, partial [Bacteroidota bacterium]|nr:type II toxin-antitoxin system antitoxin SocA domain-containing protein [Bacteroidota bacterium]